MPSGCAVDGAEAHAFGREVGRHAPAARSRLGDRRAALLLQIRRHFAREQFDEAGARQRDRMPFAGERRVRRVELRALEAFGNESVGNEVAGAAEDRIVVAARAGIRIRPAGARERGVDAALAFGWYDRLRRLRPPRAVLGREFGLEQFAPALDQRGQRGRACGRDRVEVEMRTEDSLVPTARKSGARGADHDDRAKQRRAAPAAPETFPHALADLADDVPSNWRRPCHEPSGCRKARGGLIENSELRTSEMMI